MAINYIDLAKTLDPMCHASLFEKVKIEFKTSLPLPIKFKLFQGIVFEPLLFVMYMNDSNQLQINGEIKSYADD